MAKPRLSKSASQQADSLKYKRLEECYRLEASDPKHRPAHYLISKRQRWLRSKGSNNFFSWLDEQERQTDKVVYGITYFNPVQQQAHRLIPRKDQLCNGSGKVFNTIDMRGKQKGYGAYVVKDGKLYVTEHKKGKIQHSSLLAGSEVTCAGMIKIEAGKIVAINNFSGHYQPGHNALLRAVKNLPKEVWANNAYVETVMPIFGYNFINSLTNNRYGTLRQLGKILQRISISKYHYYKDISSSKINSSTKKILNRCNNGDLSPSKKPVNQKNINEPQSQTLKSHVPHHVTQRHGLSCNETHSKKTSSKTMSCR